MGYAPREVILTDLNSSPMKEAIQRETVPFFIHEKYGILFVCRKADKIQLLEMLIAEDYGSPLREMNLYFTWPGKYQSHVFEVKRGEGLVHKMLSILNGEEDRKKELHNSFNTIAEQFTELDQKLEDLRVALIKLDMKVHPR